MTLPLIGAAAFAVTACQIDSVPETGESQEAILGGVAITEGQFPTVVGIVIANGSRGICTGTLVSSEWILTAAHCVTPEILGYSSQAEVTQNTVVYFDSAALGSTGTVASVSDTIPRLNFSEPGDTDVGLIRLSVPKTDRTPTPINYEATMSPFGVSVDMVGYGRYDIDDQEAAGRGFFLAEEPTIDCPSQLGSNSEFLCFSQTNGTGKCSGDSGGPSFVNIGGVEKVVGITSFGDRDCLQFGVDQRTDATAVKAFLRETAPELFCINDGYCQTTCNTNGLPADPDCQPCDSDAECVGDGVICDTKNNSCFVGPDAPGGLGATCEAGEPECVAGPCVTRDGKKSCAQLCSVEPDNCPANFECISVDGNSGVCFLDDGGCGCAATDSGSGLGAGILMLLSLVVIRRRRKDKRA